MAVNKVCATCNWAERNIEGVFYRSCTAPGRKRGRVEDSDSCEDWAQMSPEKAAQCCGNCSKRNVYPQEPEAADLVVEGYDQSWRCEVAGQEVATSWCCEQWDERSEDKVKHFQKVLVEVKGVVCMVGVGGDGPMVRVSHEKHEPTEESQVLVGVSDLKQFRYGQKVKIWVLEDEQ